MIYLNPWMSLAALSIAPMVLLGMSGLKGRIRELTSQQVKSIGGIAGAAQETIQGIRIVKSFSLEAPMRRRLAEAVDEAETRSNTLIHLQASRAPLMEGLGGVAIALIVIFAGWNTISEGRMPGDFMAFVTAFLLVYEPAKRLTKVNPAIAEQPRGRSHDVRAAGSAR